MPIKVVKADGNVEDFDSDKLRHSLKRAGARDEEVVTIIAHVEAIMHEGMTTREIYEHAFDILRHSPGVAVARYSLRRALFNLGPTGFPFEDFLAKLFAAEGYDTRTRIVVSGTCAEHELDVAAFKADHSFVAEAKFHSRPGMKSDLQVALYSYARLLDLKEARICSEDICGITELFLITNTKFTTAVERYAKCTGLSLLSWEYPEKDNLHDRIQRTGIYPITVLQTLNQTQKRMLIETNTITTTDIVERPEGLSVLNLERQLMEAVLEEARTIGKST